MGVACFDLLSRPSRGGFSAKGHLPHFLFLYKSYVISPDQEHLCFLSFYLRVDNTRCIPAGVCASLYDHVFLHVHATGAPSLGGNNAEVPSNVSFSFFFFVNIYVYSWK